MTIPISRGELWWLTLGVWLGGVFMLALLPVVLGPRTGTGAGVGLSWALFFVLWHPVQQITQRTIGVRAAAIRMLLFVVAAAGLAVYVRAGLFGGS
ncbi:MAG: hypothetical protein AB1635_11380 [Acidobacteriota bacterium]